MALFVFLDNTDKSYQCTKPYLVSFALASLIILELIRVTTRYIYVYLKLPSIKVSIIANRITPEKTI